MVTIYQEGVSAAEKEQIVQLHNQFRSMIMQGKVKGQPKGYNLHMLKWDDKLANAAQAIASTGIYGHKEVKDDRFPSVGQNLYKGMSTNQTEGTDWNRAVNSWYEEYEKYKWGSKSTSGAGHYTQLIWGSTECVGCGYAHTSSDDKKFKYLKYYVCNYGPAGNYIGKAPYETKAK